MRITLLFIWVCLMGHAHASSPGEAAIAYLEDIREGQINLDPGEATAISPHILNEKRLAIAARLKRLSLSLGKSKLEVGREKIEGDLAGVIIWKAEGFDPSHMQVIALGMVQRDGKWLPAPVPASFENCGIAYRAQIRQRAKTLESWMHQWKVKDLAELRERSFVRMRSDIEKQLSRDTLAKMEQREVLDRFLNACIKRNGHQIMGFVGGLSETFPDNWPMRANSIETATSNPHAPGPWRLLMSPNVVRAIIDIEDKHGPLQATIACLDPTAIAGSSARKPKIELVDIELTRTEDDLWQVELPSRFWMDQNIRIDGRPTEFDLKVLDRFAREVRKQYPPQAMDTAADCRKALIQALQENEFSKLLEITDIPQNPAEGRDSILRAAEAWGSLHGLTDEQNPASAFLMLDLDMKVIGDTAGVLVHAFSARKPDRYDPHVLFMQRAEEGWLWAPNPSEKTLQKFEHWTDEATMEQRKDWRLNLLTKCPVVKNLDPKAPSEEEAKAVVKKWIEAIEKGDVHTALQQCARLDLEDSAKVMLRNLGYEVVDALRKEGKGAVKHVLRKEAWAGVGTQPRNPENSSYSMYPVVNTDQGPKILLEIDLIASSGRGREFLNRTSLTRAGNLGEDAALPLADLFEEHCRKCLPQK